MIANVMLRQRSGKVIRPNLQVLLVIALIVALPGLLANVILMRTGSSLTDYLYAQGFDTSVTAEMLTEAVMAFYRERSWILLAAGALQLLVTPVLTLGFLNVTLTLMRGGTAVVGDVFSRRGVALRAVLLMLWIGVKMVLWALPGMALMLLSLFLDSELLILPWALGMILSTALMFVAYYRYSLATLFQADEPEMGVFACVRRSKEVMKGRKMQLFSLTLPYSLGRALAVSLGVQLLGYVFGNLVSMTIQLILSVYATGAICAFYEAYARPDGGRAHAFQADPYHDEMQE